MTTRPRVGRLDRTRFGYGFVRVGEGEDDLFVPPFAMGAALHGDLVVARYLESRREGDAHEIVEVLERSQAGIVGRLEPRGRMTLLLPERPEYPREILLALHGRASVPRGGRVVVRLDLKPPEPLQGKVIAVLGRDDAREDSWVVALEEGIRTEFEAAALAEAAAFDESSVARAAHGRADFRNEIVLTIDPEDAKDHDDALSVRRSSRGGFHEVGIHIADVSQYVSPGSALDVEAQARGNSAYLADATYPMLPEALSGGLSSLVEGKDRLTLSVVVELDEEGNVGKSRIQSGVVRSAASLSYPEAARLAREGGDGIPASLALLDRIGRGLRRRRLEEGGLDIDLPEVRARLDERGEPERFEETKRLPTHELVEEYMLLANRIVGGRALARELPFFYRVHERPRYDKLRAFFDAARYLGRSGAVPFVTEAKQLRRWATPGKTTRDRIVNLYLLRAMEKARYDLVDVGHFGLGMRGYAHFTSPIRRYADLANHRIVKRYLLDGQKPGGDPWTFADGWMSEGVASHISATEMKADDAERAVTKVKAVRYAQLRLGEEARGTIVGLTPGGLFVFLEGWSIEGFLPKRAIGDPSLTLAEHGFSFRSKRTRHRFGLGDPVDVVLARADLERREIELGLRTRAARRPKHPGRAKKKARGGRQGTRR